MTDYTNPKDAISVRKDITVLEDIADNAAGGATGDASAAKQDIIITALNTLNGNVDGLENLLTVLNTYVDTLEALNTTGNTAANALNGYVDGLETLITASNTSATALNGYVDGLEGTATLLNDYVDGLETTATALNLLVDGLEAQTGSVIEAAPATDSASSGLNGRLQRIASRLTTLIGLIPSSLGTKTSALSLSVVLASDQAITTSSIGAASSNGNGATNARINAAATTNLTSIKTSPGKLYGWHIDNISANPIYIKFYGKASAPIVATDTPIFIIAIPANGKSQHSLAQGIAFPLGIAYAITGGVADTDATAVLSPSAIGSLQWI